GAYAERALRSASEGLDERERAFARQLAYGTVQRVRTLDHAIGALGKRPVRKLDPPVKAALRLGAYQLGYLDVAPHAAVNESVELVRRAKLERAVPFTNAVLRRLTEGMRALLDSLPDGPLKESYPDWIFDVWSRDFGRDGREVDGAARRRRRGRDQRRSCARARGERAPPRRDERARRTGGCDRTAGGVARLRPRTRRRALLRPRRPRPATRPSLARATA